MRIGYFTNQYPSVSHTFIRREILELERVGIDVVRYAIRSDRSSLVDPDDFAEYDSTAFLSRIPVSMGIWLIFRQFLRSPGSTLAAIRAALVLGWNSDVGVARHLAYFWAATLLVNRCELDRVTHLHVHFGTNPAAIALIAARMSRLSFSVTIHGYEEFYRASFLSIEEKVRASSFVVSVSKYGTSQLMRVCSHSLWKKIATVYCGLDSKFLDTKEHPVVGGRQFCSVGRLCAEKAQILMVEAVAVLRQRGVDCELVLVGDGPMRKDVEARIGELGLGDRIFLRGSASGDQVKQEIIASRALLMTSFVENLPVGIMESLALGRPVIATYIGGIPELVTPNSNGWLIPAGDCIALADSMESALKLSNAELESMAIDCKRSVAGNHDIRTEVQKLKRLFEKVNSTCT